MSERATAPHIPPKVVPAIIPGFVPAVVFFAGVLGAVEELEVGGEVIGEARVLSLSVDGRTMLAKPTTTMGEGLFTAAFVGEGVSILSASSTERVLTFASSHQHPSLKEIL